MYHCEEEARQEGIRLLEAHVKLLREARATLSARRLDRTACADRKGGERLLQEIEKVEERLEIWQKAYECQYLQGNNIWDVLRNEEIEQNGETSRAREDEAEESGKVPENSPKAIENEKYKTENATLWEGDEEDEGKNKELTRERDDKAFMNCNDQIYKINRENEAKFGNETANQESDVKFGAEKKKAQEALRPAGDDRRGQKRQLEEIDEGEEESRKRRKVMSPEGSSPKPTESCRVLVQNLPLAVPYSEFRAYFMKFGTVYKVFLKPGHGCGFVIYENESIADLVCNLQHKIGGNELKVMRDAPRPATHVPSCPEATASQDSEVFVFGLPRQADPQALSSVLSVFGPVVSVKQPCRKTYAFVRFENESSKEAALQARTVTFNNRTVVIRQTRTSSEEEKTEGKGDAVQEAAVTDSDRSRKGYQVFMFGVTIPMDLHGFKQGLARFGTVVSAYMPEDRNYAFVGFEKEESQQAAIEAGNISLPCGRVVIKPVSRR